MDDPALSKNQFAMSVRQADEAVELADAWIHDLCHAAEASQMDHTAHKLEQAMQALGEAHAALEGCEDALARDLGPDDSTGLA